MNKPILLLLFLFSCTGAFAQNVKEQAKVDSEYYYMLTDRILASSAKTAKFIRLYTNVDSGMLKVEEFYLNDKPKLVVKTSRKELDFQSGMQGYCMEYYENGHRKSIKNYNKGVLVGEAVEYYPNGGLFSIIDYKADGIYYLKSCQDSTGKTLAENGNGVWLKFNADMDPTAFLKGPVVNGKEDGEWKRHVVDTVYSIVYKQGEIVSGKEFLKDNVFEKVEVLPSFPGGYTELNKYLSRNVQYPKGARDNNVQGRVIVSFMVEKDGTLTNVKLVRGIGSGCDEESVRVMSISPKWNPGLNHGKPVRVQYSMPVAFALSTQ
jgi:TonB family protein